MLPPQKARGKTKGLSEKMWGKILKKLDRKQISRIFSTYFLRSMHEIQENLITI
jgi:hypothetical protein